MPVTYNLIASNTLTGTATAVTFSSIPNTYTDLLIKASIRGDLSSGAFDTQVRLRLNGDTATNYSRTIIYGNGSTAVSTRNSSQTYVENIAINSATSTANTFASFEVYIPSYLASQNKPFAINSAAETNSTLAYVEADAALWRNTAAITSVTLTANANNFVAGSSFFLYGIKNS